MSEALERAPFPFLIPVGCIIEILVSTSSHQRAGCGVPDGMGRWLRGEPGSKCVWPLMHPVYPLGLALASPGSVMSPHVLLGLVCCSSGFMFSVAVEGGALASSSPLSTEGPQGRLGQVLVLGRWCRAAGRPARDQPPVWMGY